MTVFLIMLYFRLIWLEWSAGQSSVKDILPHSGEVVWDVSEACRQFKVTVDTHPTLYCILKRCCAQL